MKQALLIDVRTGETGTLSQFFEKRTMSELGYFIKPVSKAEARKIQEALKNRKVK